MTPPFDRIEFIADQAADRYRGVLEIMRSQETGALGHNSAISPRGVSQLKRSLEQVGDSFLAWEEGHLIEALEEMRGMAWAEAERQLPGRQSEDIPAGFMDLFHDFAIDELEAQLVRDVAQLLRVHRKRGLDVALRATSRGISPEVALMEVRIEAMGDRVALWFTDRAGRRIASQKHVRRFYRGLLREGYMSALATSLALRGALRARITHPDPRARGYGEIVNLDGSKPNLQSYETVFHPNAQASLLAEEVFEKEQV